MPELIRSPLAEIHLSQGATLGEYHGAQVPTRFQDPKTEHQAAREAGGLFDFSFRAKFAVKGADRTSFLHNMLSNDVKGLAAGQGTYACLLDVKGHIIADLRVYCTPEVLLVDTDADLREKTIETLDRFIVMDEVELEPLNLFAVAFQGPRSRQLAETVLNLHLSPDEEFRHVMASYAGSSVRVVRASSTGDEGYEVWAEAEILETLWGAALRRAVPLGMRPCGTESLETLRIEAGIPRYGSELDEETIPLEAGLLNALSFNKGCYLGQEIIERARSRGHVNWKLVGLVVASSAVPAAGERLFTVGDDKRHLGEITSAGFSPTLGQMLALAYVRREVSEPGARLVLASGAHAEVHELPFAKRESGN
jgi:glycine cleavage system T protein